MKNLKIVRKQKKISQEQLGKHLGFGKNTISQYESGVREPSLLTLKALAKYFNVTVDYLIGNDTENKIAEIQPQQTEQQKNCIEMIMQLDEELLSKAEIFLTGLSARTETFVLKKMK